MVKIDWMHCADLGVLVYNVYLLGEVLWSLLDDLAGLAVGTLAARRARGFKELKKRIRQYYSEKRISTRVPLKRFKVTRIKSGNKSPKLGVKAVQARKLLPLAPCLVARYCGLRGRFGENRFQCVHILCKIYELSNKLELSADELQEWRWNNCLFMSEGCKRARQTIVSNTHMIALRMIWKFRGSEQRIRRAPGGGSQRTHKDFAEDSERIGRGSTEGAQRVCRGLAEDLQGTDRGLAVDLQRTHGGPTKDSLRFRQGLAQLAGQGFRQGLT